MATDTIPEVRPYRLGVVDDLPTLRAAFGDDFMHGVELAVADAFESGLVDRPIELIRREAIAHPWDDARPVIDAVVDLAENERVLGIAGPMTSDNSLSVLSDVERTGVPTISICGSQHFLGDYAFSLPNGGLAEEPWLMASWLRSEGHRRIVVLKDAPSQIGEEYDRNFQLAATDKGLTIVGTAPVPPAADLDEIRPAVKALHDVAPDALVYFGLGQLTRKSAPAFEELDWDPPRIMTTAFVGADMSPDKARRLNGWVGVDQYHEGNEVFQKVAGRWEKRFGEQPRGCAATVGYDVGNVLARGLGRMRIATPAALRDALETINSLPSCTGGPGTIISFGPRDHRGYKGADYLLLRKAENGGTSLVGTVPITGDPSGYSD